MPQHEQTLPADQSKVETLSRWLAYQTTVDEVLEERERQVEQWGIQDIPLGTTVTWKMAQDFFRDICQTKTAGGTVTYTDVLLEEVFEFASEENPAKARDELVQVAAVVFAIIEGIDRRAAAGV